MEDDLETAKATASSVAQRIARNFIRVVLIYMLIGITWMGYGFFLPSPSGKGAGDVFDTDRFHLLFVGWVAFVMLGVLYDAVPRMAGNPLYSLRLGHIHFWISNLVLPVVTVMMLWLTFAYQSMLNSPSLSATSSKPAGFMAIETVILLLSAVGIVAQGLFTYNVYRTFGSQRT
ncbi:MAG: cbb3-type cytochrome c oxidase subunit I [Chloroflexi bacterium]|nr:cbb3-type cytochrome c oxidase subunit I [Chloroflexota bacterium]